MSVKIGINGFGRIGRMVFRAALPHPDVEVVAVNDLGDSETMAHLLQYDSVHGKLGAEVTAAEDALTVDGRRVAITSVRDPADLPWKDLGVDVVAECTGIFRDRDQRGPAPGRRRPQGDHLRAGQGSRYHHRHGGQLVNQYDPRRHHIVSNASCTTNCLAPVAKVLLEKLRYPLRADDHRARLYRRSASAGLPPQGSATRPGCGPVHDPHHHRRGQGRGPGPAGTGRQAQRPGHCACPPPTCPSWTWWPRWKRAGVTVRGGQRGPSKQAPKASLAGIMGFSNDLPLVSTRLQRLDPVFHRGRPHHLCG